MNDYELLNEAIRVGNEVAAPYNFGAVVAKDGKAVAVQHGYVFAHNDPSAHAEITAIREASKALASSNLSGCTLYASHEPCMVCLGCAAWAKIPRIVYAHEASESAPEMYELKEPDIQRLGEQLSSPVTIVHVEP